MTRMTTSYTRSDRPGKSPRTAAVCQPAHEAEGWHSGIQRQSGEGRASDAPVAARRGASQSASRMNLTCRRTSRP
jgi:hypothetical protein